MKLKKKVFLNLILILLVSLIFAGGTNATSLFDNVTVRSTNVFTMETLGASIGETFTVDGITYTVTDTTNNYVAVSDCDTSLSGALSIPGEVDSYTVTSIESDAFQYCSSLTEVIIPDSVINIGSCAFYACSSLTEVTIPDSVTNIRNSAFSGCSSLLSIEIPNSVTSIGSSAFSGCRSLTEVTIPCGIGYSAFNGCSGLTEVTILDGVTSIGYNAFAGCSSLLSVEIPYSVTSIGYGPFANCENLKEIIVNVDNTKYASINGILYNKNGTALIQVPAGKEESIIIPGSVTSIGNSAFSGCSSLTEVIIPDSVNTIASNAFYKCNNLTIYGFSGSQAQTHAEVNSIKFLALDSFKYEYDETAKTAIIIGIKEDATLSEKIVLPSQIINSEGTVYTLTAIGESAFKNCEDITSITIPDTVKTIGTSAFDSCINLTDVVIQEGLETIGSSAFNGCSNLTRVTILNSKTSIENNAFEGCDNLIICGYSGSTAESYAKACDINFLALASFKYEYNETTKTATIIGITEGVTLSGKIVLPSQILNEDEITYTITDIGSSAFSGCSALTKVTIPDTVTSIKNSAFSGCSALTEIIIPNSVTSIGSSAFYGCSALTKVIIPNSVTSINYSAFSGCSELTEIIIPNSVTSIGYKAIAGSNVFDKCNNVTIYGFSGSTAESYAMEWDINFLALDSFEYEYDETAKTATIIGITEDVALSGKIVLPSQIINLEGTVYTLISIGDSVFKDCEDITSITIPSEVKSVATEAFRGCISLEEVIVNINDANVAEMAGWGTDVFVDSNENLKMYVRLGSSAEVYAQNNNITYEIMDKVKIVRTEDEQTKTYGYLSLTEAIENAKLNDVIILLTSITENVGVDSSKSITIDLNENTITGTIENNGILLITNGNVNGTVTNTGELTIGKDINDTVVVGDTYGIINTETGTAYIYGGKIKGKTNAINKLETISPETEGYKIVTTSEGGYEVLQLGRAYIRTTDIVKNPAIEDIDEDGIIFDYDVKLINACYYWTEGKEPPQELQKEVEYINSFRGEHEQITAEYLAKRCDITGNGQVDFGDLQMVLAKNNSALKESTINFGIQTEPEGLEVVWSVVDLDENEVELGTTERAEIDATTGVFTAKNTGKVKVKATYGNNSLTEELVINIIEYEITYDLAGGNLEEGKENPSIYTAVTEGTVLNNPIKVGYTFKGWTGSNGEVPQTEVTIGKATGDLSYTANWEVNSYKLTINYVYEDGNVASEAYTKAVNYKEQYTVTSPVIAGYTADALIVEGTMGLENANITVTYTANTNTKYTVEHYKQNIQDDEYTKVETEQKEGTTGEQTEAVEKEYVGFTAQKITQKAISGEGTTVVEIYYIRNSYTITFDTDGGSKVEAITLTFGSEITEPQAPTKTGYIFAGWDKEIPSKMPAEDILITAKWTRNSYTITFDTDGGSTVEAITQDFGTDITAPANPTKKGYTFAGWDKEVPNTMPAEDVLITAKWNLVNYVITYDLKDGNLEEGKENPTSYTIETGNFTLNNPIKTGYTFKGWTGSNGDVPQLNVVVEKGTIENLSYTANWEINKYTVIWKNYDGTVLEEDKEVEYGKMPIYDGATPTKAETAEYTYTFKGWSPEVEAVTGDATYTAEYTATVNKYMITWKNYDGTELEIDEEVEYGTTPSYDGATPTKEATAEYTYTFKGWSPEVEVVTGDTTYTAEYTATVNKYTITWKNYDGTVLEEDEEVEYGKMPTYDGAMPTKAETAEYTYTFAGWSPEVVKVTGEVEYIAKYTEEAKTYTITFNTDGGSEIEPITLTFGSEITEPQEPTKEGYTFVGWSPELPEKMQAEDITLTAIWEVNSYKLTINYVYEDGSKAQEPHEETIKYGENYKVETPKVVGYTPNEVTVEGTMGAEDVNITVTYVASKLEKIEIIEGPDKIEYKAGETFDKTGMKVKAIYDNEDKKEIEEYEVEPNRKLYVTDKVVTVIYTERGITKEAEIEITVGKAEGTENPEYKISLGKLEAEGAKEITYYEGLKLADVELLEDWEWKKPETLLYANGEGEAHPIIYISKNENYENVEAKIMVKVEKAEPKYESLEEIEAEKGETLGEIKHKLPARYEFMEGEETLVGEIGYNEFKVRYIPEDEANYKIVENIPVIIHVVAKEIPVADISIINEMKLVKGAKVKLEVNIEPEEATNKGIEWISSNSNIVEVDEHGYIVAKETGVTYVVVKTIEGGKTASCRIEVIEKSYDVEEGETAESIYITNINPNTTKAIFEEKFPSIYRIEIHNQEGKEVGEEIIGTGYTISLYDGEELKEEGIQVIVKGDVTGEGAVDGVDSGKLIYHRLDKEKLVGVYEKAGDVNKDGIINGIDSTILIYHRLNMPGFEWKN